jgi:hypothetical protein
MTDKKNFQDYLHKVKDQSYKNELTEYEDISDDEDDLEKHSHINDFDDEFEDDEEFDEEEEDEEFDEEEDEEENDDDDDEDESK